MTAKTDALMTEHEVATRLPLEGAANGSKGLVTAKGVKVFLVGMGL